ncbi:MAG: mannose-1-phosphate guanylyltransferase [Mycobacteriales bacterium]
MSDSHFYAVIPAGGSGTRLWPMSRASHPKFLLDLGGGRSLLRATIDRLGPLAPQDRIYVVTGAAHVRAIAGQLPDVPGPNLLVEPGPRDSAPAIGLAAALIHRRDPDAVMGSFAADHLVRDRAAFEAAVRAAAGAAAAGYLVTVGLRPTGPETGYGYLRRGDPIDGPTGDPGARTAYHAEEFKEKPSAATAERYVADGDYLWNASMFVWRTDAFLAELQRQQPDLSAGLGRIVAAWDGPDRDRVLGEVWAGLPKINVDQGVMEDAARRGRVATVPASLGWDDVGDWDTIARVLPRDGDGVVTMRDGPVVCIDSRNTLVAGDSGRVVAVVGVDDLVVVDTDDALLVCRRDHAQQVKAVVDDLNRRGRTDLV